MVATIALAAALAAFALAGVHSAPTSANDIVRRQSHTSCTDRELAAYRACRAKCETSDIRWSPRYESCITDCVGDYPVCAFHRDQPPSNTQWTATGSGTINNDPAVQWMESAQTNSNSDPPAGSANTASSVDVEWTQEEARRTAGDVAVASATVNVVSNVHAETTNTFTNGAIIDSSNHPSRRQPEGFDFGACLQSCLIAAPGATWDMCANSCSAALL